MSDNDVLYGYRLRLFSLAAEIVSVPPFGRWGYNLTYYRLKARVDRWGLEALRPRERRRPRMPNELGPDLEQRVLLSRSPIRASARSGSAPSCGGMA